MARAISIAVAVFIQDPKGKSKINCGESNINRSGYFSSMLKKQEQNQLLREKNLIAMAV